MNTDDLVSMLSTGVEPVDPNTIAKRLSLAILIGGVGALLVILLRFGLRPDLAEVALTSIFWAKIAFPLSLMMGSLLMVMRLARPGMTAGGGKLWVTLGVAAIWGGALYGLAVAPADDRIAMVLGKTWKVCAFNITVLSVPGFVSMFWALRGLAPTRPRLAGACSGLLASSLATLAYCLHCPEMAVPFWGVWYLLGMLVPTLIGAAMGERWLRW
ncbi:DUF1109 family protein [Pseudomonas marginalis]|uniref:DUF1109 domain-containing protein n=1 Tax=Pseudomonas marginalis TaxID=298 RepID=UPI001F45E838|nr:DUF1109 domain-containing protein [Pseudomonas marginalis]MCF5669014.1 DUF1109 family protein [Pseudomonas marginalis]